MVMAVEPWVAQSGLAYYIRLLSFDDKSMGFAMKSGARQVFEIVPGGFPYRRRQGKAYLGARTSQPASVANPMAERYWGVTQARRFGGVD